MNKLITILIVFLISFNTVAPASSAAAMDNGLLCKIIESQSSLLYYTSFSVIPLKIVTMLMTGTAAKSAPVRSESGKKQDKENAAAASTIFISAESAKELLQRSNLVKSTSNLVTLVSSALAHGKDVFFALAALQTFFSGFVISLFIMGLCFAQLPRGDVDAYRKNLIYTLKNLIRITGSGFFFERRTR